MRILASRALKTVELLLSSRAGTTEFAVQALLAVLTAVIVLRVSSGLLDFPMKGTGRSFLAVFTTVTAAVAALSAVFVYVSPTVSRPLLRILLPAAAAMAAVLAVGVPVTCFIHKSKYLSSLFALLLGMAGAVLVSLMVNAAFNAVHHGGKQMTRVRSRTSTINDILDD
ncbi:MAG: hypothetical protein R6V03_00665 [Kiritimatiellia bacterium]